MTGAALLGVFETIGSIVGILITLITFVGLISKRPRAAFRKVIREEAAAANQELKEQINEVDQKLNETNKKLKEAEATDLVMLRNAITSIYFEYKDKKEIPHYAKENWLYLYKKYENMKGNSYVKNITQEMSDKWKAI